MSDEKPDAPRGWGRPALSRKFHWFEDGTSLCNRWLGFTPHSCDDGPPGGDGYGINDPAGDCAACWSVITRRREAASPVLRAKEGGDAQRPG